MEDRSNGNTLWNKFFDTDSITGTGRFVLLILVFIVIGGGLSWLVG
ncbi:hypothetical protein [Neorhizobium sp. DT-125]